MENAIKITDLSVSYGQNEAIENINLNISKGEFVCIIGPNGGGKTTLLNTILGFLKSEKGSIEIFGKEPSKANKNLSYVPQFAEIEKNFPITVLETVLTGFLKKGIELFRVYSSDEKTKATEILKKIGLDGYSKRQISQLSGGEFQRLLIARVLATQSEILLLDEPTANIDFLSAKKIFEILKDLNKSGKTIILVTHDILSAKKYADKIICINGNLIYSKKKEEFSNIKEDIYYISSYKEDKDD